ncbi:MAG TPA: DUF397 domain-containing protein [Pilimelia sp.]|nr:DUF397 domain-containing protein [Pilimelia sp.]
MNPTGPSTLAWRKSRRCESSTCVEVAPVDRAVAMRDSTDPAVHLVFAAGDWHAFLDGVRAGEFDGR